MQAYHTHKGRGKRHVSKPGLSPLDKFIRSKNTEKLMDEFRVRANI